MTAATAVTLVLFFCSWWWATGYKQLSGTGSAGSLLSVPPPPFWTFLRLFFNAPVSDWRLQVQKRTYRQLEETKWSKRDFTPLSSEDRTWKQQRFWYFLSRAVNHRLPCWWENWAESLLGSYSPMSIGEIRVSEQYFHNHYFLLLVKLWVRLLMHGGGGGF